MKITRISVYHIDLPLEFPYWLSGGRLKFEVLDATIVKIETDAGITGHGEVCPLGPFYLPSYAAGARAGIGELAPHLLGRDPTQLDTLNRAMDTALQRDVAFKVVRADLGGAGAPASGDASDSGPMTATPPAEGSA